jgi:hypothetical protein
MTNSWKSEHEQEGRGGDEGIVVGIEFMSSRHVTSMGALKTRYVDGPSQDTVRRWALSRHVTSMGPNEYGSDYHVLQYLS